MMGAIEQTLNTYDEPTFEREMNSISWLLIRLMLVMVPIVFSANGLTDGDRLEGWSFCFECYVLDLHQKCYQWLLQPAWP